MSMSDPIADMLTRIRNANTAKHDTVEIPASKMKKAIADILLSEGYVQAVDIIEDGKFETIKITLLTMNYTVIPKSIVNFQTGNSKPIDIYV